ncbi:retropepsin-like domain-containing protein [Gluconacetobacter azotocaptans]|uniref:retropepsin-like aspartic protease n=1 Tax=Gluconacetobacter azotocaptans TaxID=142834 RepID=UPI00195B98A0|nr:retropepsin-like aspartic protease [Gluconacetobacter azotocaptans]MBM9403306.1 retropepsin-like domain-containing protein [Gluconacetobacter azotocaptans]
MGLSSRAVVLVPAALLVVFWAVRARAAEGAGRADVEVVPERCVAHVITAPLLTGDGSPAIPVRINGMAGAAFLGMTQESLGVFERADMHYPVGKALPVQTVTGEGRSYTTMVDDLVIGLGTAHHINGVMLGPFGEQKIAGRSVLGVLGYDILGNYNVLLDFPNQTLTLFKESGAPGCPPVSLLVGARPYAAALMPDARGMDVMVQVTINAVPIGMEVEPGSNASIIRAADAADAGVGPPELANDPRSRTDAGTAIVGHRHRFDQLVLGTLHGAVLQADVAKAAYNILGVDFFRNRTVLFAFPSRMLYFSDPQAPTGTEMAHSGLSPAQSRMADATVEEQP